jgi:hypothetical protein
MSSSTLLHLTAYNGMARSKTLLQAIDSEAAVGFDTK